MLESIFHITNMFCEVPTGYIDDRFGRKTSRILGRGAAFISTVLMITGNSFWQFALGIIFTALSCNLESGAGDALIYDSMVECGQEDQYMKVRGRQEICFHAAKPLYFYFQNFLKSMGYMEYQIGLCLQSARLQGFWHQRLHTG